MQSVQKRSFSGPYFPVIGLIMDRKNSAFGQFLRSEYQKWILKLFSFPHIIVEILKNHNTIIKFCKFRQSTTKTNSQQKLTQYMISAKTL